MSRARSLARHAALRAVVAASGLVAVVLTCVAAVGLLYQVAAWRTPGTQVLDALPLDELPHRSGSGAIAFVAVWAGAAVILGLVARSLGAGRLVGAAWLGASVATWSVIATTVSLAIVRQTSLAPALHAALGLPAVAVPAVLCGVGGALLGRPRREACHRSSVPLALLVAATGALTLLEAVLPAHSRFAVVDYLAPARVHPLTSALVAPLGIALVALARGLRRRKRRAWQASLLLLVVTSALHLLHSFNAGALVTVAVAVALIAGRDEFSAPGDPAAPPRLARRAALLLVGLYAYGFVAIWANRVTADQPYSIGLAVRETSASIVGMEWNGSAHLTGEFAEWFGVSVFVVALVGVAWLLRAWVAPWRYRNLLEDRERRVAHGLVTQWGVDTLSPFALRADKSYFFGEDEGAFLAYRVVGGVAVVAGDPIGDPGGFPALFAHFIAHAHARGWRVAVLGASEQRLALYHGLGLQSLYHGDEAVLDVAAFSLDGRSIRKVRQSGHRLVAAGFTTVTLPAGDIVPELRDRLARIAEDWRGDQPERGFTMALDSLFRLEGDDALFVIGLDPAGEPAGFLHFAVSRAGSALSLSTMPRNRSTPNGFNEWLVCEAVAWARSNGVRRVSLNFAPFAALLAPEAEPSGTRRVQRRALLALKGHFQLDNLLLFNRKFLPGWERRFVVYERRADLPRVGFAALAAEAYLPKLPSLAGLRSRLPTRRSRRRDEPAFARGRT